MSHFVLLEIITPKWAHVSFAIIIIYFASDCSCAKEIDICGM